MFIVKYELVYLCICLYLVDENIWCCVWWLRFHIWPIQTFERAIMRMKFPHEEKSCW